MLKKQKLGPRAFLKSQGVKFDKSIRSLDLAFLRSFPTEKQDKVREVWERIHTGLATVQELYDLPETREQVSLLVSHDAARMVASLAWFEATIASEGAKSVVEFGAGAGYLLNYLRYCHPELALAGVERQPNFSSLIDQDDRFIVYQGDYRDIIPAQCFDLVICDFGWDNHEIPPSTKPHSSSEIAGYGFCPGCSDDEIPFFVSMLEAWKRWAQPDASLAVAGRLMDLIDLRAIVLAAEQQGWHLDASRSTQLVVSNLLGEKEKFPALFFTSTRQFSSLEAIEMFLQSHGW